MCYSGLNIGLLYCLATRSGYFPVVFELQHLKIYPKFQDSQNQIHGQCFLCVQKLLRAVFGDVCPSDAQSCDAILVFRFPPRRPRPPVCRTVCRRHQLLRFSTFALLRFCAFAFLRFCVLHL